MPPFPRSRAPIRPNQDTMVVNGPFNKVLFLFGGYIGEVFSKHRGGRYVPVAVGVSKEFYYKNLMIKTVPTNPRFLHL